MQAAICDTSFMDHISTGEPFLLGMAALLSLVCWSWHRWELVAGVSAAGVVAHPLYKQLWPWGNSANRSELQQPFSVKQVAHAKNVLPEGYKFKYK